MVLLDGCTFFCPGHGLMEVGKEPASFPRRSFSPNCHLFAHHLQLVLPSLKVPKGMSAFVMVMPFPKWVFCSLLISSLSSLNIRQTALITISPRVLVRIPFPKLSHFLFWSLHLPLCHIPVYSGGELLNRGTTDILDPIFVYFFSRGPVLCIVGRLTASLASTYWMPIAPSPRCDKHNSLQTLPDVSWKQCQPWLNCKLLEDMSHVLLTFASLKSDT